MTTTPLVPRVRVLEAAKGAVTARMQAEVDLLVAAAEWCVLHPATEATGYAGFGEDPVFGEALVPLAGLGSSRLSMSSPPSASRAAVRWPARESPCRVTSTAVGSSSLVMPLVRSTPGPCSHGPRSDHRQLHGVRLVSSPSCPPSTGGSPVAPEEGAAKPERSPPHPRLGRTGGGAALLCSGEQSPFWLDVPSKKRALSAPKDIITPVSIPPGRHAALRGCYDAARASSSALD